MTIIISWNDGEWLVASFTGPAKASLRKKNYLIKNLKNKEKATQWRSGVETFHATGHLGHKAKR